jgi:hypothetical protein
VDNDVEVSAARCNLGMALLDLGGAANKAEAKVHLDPALALNSDNEQAQVRPSPVRADPFNPYPAAQEYLAEHWNDEL